ncbi:hypothetical protein Psi01_82980 [Planobispora siamensis]|uniref:LysR substrate-binding domain-containing protein n=1 Tax=Planobispora siamensis TaxID=936338 RepID=A0A8J3WPV4_9ACTN|nr:hypothetical protein Psi01_82980 [Planobispora siamensis]
MAFRPPNALGRLKRRCRVCSGPDAANEATQDIIAKFGRIRPGWRVNTRQATWSEPSAGLADGKVDAALLRLPFPGQETFRVEVLLTEPR